MLDNRCNERDRCEIAAEYRPVKSETTSPCLVSNISESGAGLDLPDMAGLPAQFVLVLPILDGVVHERAVQLRWQNGRSAGVLFL